MPAFSRLSSLSSKIDLIMEVYAIILGSTSDAEMESLASRLDSPDLSFFIAKLGRPTRKKVIFSFTGSGSDVLMYKSPTEGDLVRQKPFSIKWQVNVFEIRKKDNTEWWLITDGKEMWMKAAGLVQGT